jgi:hypothetical protein
MIEKLFFHQTKDKIEELTLISILIPPERIDAHAEKIKTFGSLSNMHS